MKNEAALAAIFGKLEDIVNASDIDTVFAMAKERNTQINRRIAGEFRLGQMVNFMSEKDGPMSGEIESIGRTGRVKVKLVNSRWSHYTMGAGFLKENLR